MNKNLRKLLLVTEKCTTEADQNDGGSRVVETLCQHLYNHIDVVQFGPKPRSIAKYYYPYDNQYTSRFEARINRAPFIAEKIYPIIKHYTDIIFIHASLQFSLKYMNIFEKTIWCFPMFLTPSYKLSGEQIPSVYFSLEKEVLKKSNTLITPSFYEQRQLTDIYNVNQNDIAVIPRSIPDIFFKHRPKHRTLSSAIKFCHIASIKPQKNTLEMVKSFHRLVKKYPKATLDIIGAEQNHAYAKKVKDEIIKNHLSDNIRLLGPLHHQALMDAIKNYHIHISFSSCETFGRTIFETLANGIPNIILAKNNAAYDYLKDKPYITFFDDKKLFLDAVDKQLANYQEHVNQTLEMKYYFGEMKVGKDLIKCLLNEKTITR